jgi:hypothetical protein
MAPVLIAIGAAIAVLVVITIAIRKRSDRVLTYAEVMKYFLDHKGDKPEIVKGSLLKEKIEGGYLITQAFLNKEGKLVEGEMGRPLGCKRRVRRLDGELLNLFKNEDLVVVE